MLSAAINKAGSTEPDKIRAAILSTRGYKGAEGEYNFDEFGDDLHGYNIVRNEKGIIVFDKHIEFTDRPATNASVTWASSSALSSLPKGELRSLSKVAMRSDSSTNSGEPGVVRRSTKATIAFFGPVFHDGSGSFALTAST